jgi:dTDP-4-amino-4,6-dideoxygalactose transaminase
VPWIAKSLGLDVRFVDCELDTLGMDPAALSHVISDRTRVVITAHLYGVPCRIREIAALAEQHGAALIEDCAHCMGASVAGRLAGAWGQAACFSFETSKPVNTLGGGMIALRDPTLEKRVRDLAAAQPRHHPSWLLQRLGKAAFEAIATHPLVFDLGTYPLLRLLSRGRGDGERFESGYQADEVSMQGRLGRYSSYQARLGLRQLQRIEPGLARRAHNAERLMSGTGEHLAYQSAEPDAEANYMLATARVQGLERWTAELLRLGVDTKHHYMRDCSAITDSDESFPNAARAEREVLHLPAYPQLSDHEIDQVAAAIVRVAADTGARS